MVERYRTTRLVFRKEKTTAIATKQPNHSIKAGNPGPDITRSVVA